MFRVYRFFISPLLHLVSGPGTGCRYEPTCGVFAEQAFKQYSGLRSGKALVLVMKRVLRCHPWAKADLYFDPVPAEDPKPKVKS